MTATYRAAREACRKHLDKLGITDPGTRTDKMHWPAVYAEEMVAGTWKFGPPRKDKDGFYAVALEAARKRAAA